MNTPDVIATIQNATQAIQSLLTQQEAQINEQQRNNDRLEARVESLESLLQRTREDRNSLSDALNEANMNLRKLHTEHDTLKVDNDNVVHFYEELIEDHDAVCEDRQRIMEERNEAQAELKKLKEIILSIGIAVEPVLTTQAVKEVAQVVPAPMPDPIEDASSEPVKPYHELEGYNKVSDAPKPHWMEQPRDPVTQRFVDRTSIDDEGNMVRHFNDGSSETDKPHAVSNVEEKKADPEDAPRPLKEAWGY